MIWLVLALIGAGTFFVTGFNLLTDPLCVSADFGGGRVVQVTCRSDEFGTVSGTQAGLISILIGLGILTFLFWRPIKLYFIRNKILKEARKQIGDDDTNSEIKNSKSELGVNSSGDTKKCPKCAEDIKVEAIKCRFCGSDLGPKGIEKTSELTTKFVKKYFRDEYSFQIGVIILVLVGGLIYGVVNISKSREISALKESGQICVVGTGGEANFGCADYPNIKFRICSEYEFVDWTAYIPEFTFLDWSPNTYISQGLTSLSCTNTKYPYLYSIDLALAEFPRVGEYDVRGQAYASLRSEDYIEGSENLIAKVSLKK